MELVSAVGVPLSIRTILQIMGVPVERANAFQRWGGAITDALGGHPDAIQAGGLALTELFGYLQTLIDGIRAGESATTELADAVLADLVHVEDEGDRLTDEEICQVTMQLITAGYETTSTALANGLHALCEHPDQRTAFEASDRMGVRAAVEEILRYAGPQAGLFRTAAHDIELSGCPIPKNGKVRAAFASANHDEQAFRDADSFNITRSPVELRKHLAFGLGPHACIGASLARAELVAAFGTLFRRLPGLELDAEVPPTRNTSKLTITGFTSLRIRWDPDRVHGRAERPTSSDVPR
jgi:cytochrome P450